ncbi:MAG: hypothetical protein P4M09_00235 [Devosia sp.]|nr:hypothetical protein [Devosia sp.]
MVPYWRGLREKRARALGLSDLTNQELSQVDDREDILRRLRLLIANNALDDGNEVAAVLGGEKRPSLHLSGLVDEVKAIESAALLQYSPAQQKRWRAPKDKVVADLIALLASSRYRP